MGTWEKRREMFKEIFMKFELWCLMTFITHGILSKIHYIHHCDVEWILLKNKMCPKCGLNMSEVES